VRLPPIPINPQRVQEFRGLVLSPFDWGICETRGKRRHRRCIARVGKILDRYRPDALIIRDTSSQGHRTPRAASLNATTSEMANNRGIPIHAYSRDHVRDAFEYAGVVNKHSMAQLIAKHVPTFERHVPPPRKPWMSEDRRMALFDAAALGVVFFGKKGLSEGTDHSAN
jgi:hypothetical protein